LEEIIYNYILTAFFERRTIANGTSGGCPAFKQKGDNITVSELAKGTLWETGRAICFIQAPGRAGQREGNGAERGRSGRN